MRRGCRGPRTLFLIWAWVVWSRKIWACLPCQLSTGCSQGKKLWNSTNLSEDETSSLPTQSSWSSADRPESRGVRMKVILLIWIARVRKVTFFLPTHHTHVGGFFPLKTNWLSLEIWNADGKFSGRSSKEDIHTLEWKRKKTVKLVMNENRIRDKEKHRMWKWGKNNGKTRRL